MSIMKFCSECDNLLYPMQDQEQRSLLYTCRNCDYQEEVEDGDCVFKIEVNRSVGDDGRRILEDITADPTVPRSKSVRCAKCNHGEAVFFQVESITISYWNCGSRAPTTI
ncbi:DNA-directed RNA polymerases II [Ranunculus cassubicifolius]